MLTFQAYSVARAYVHTPANCKVSYFFWIISFFKEKTYIITHFDEKKLSFLEEVFTNTEIEIDIKTQNKLMREIVSALKHTIEAKNIVSLSAPAIGYNRRIFCIKFDNEIKTFINPIITKKNGLNIVIETCAAMPGKEIVIGRPEEITVVYYNDEFKYEDNKLVGVAASMFDQQAQLLDGILPDDLGLVSDVATDGSLADLTEEEITELVDFYKEYVKVKSEALQQTITEDPELNAEYKKLAFSEKVVNGQAAIIAEDGSQMKQKAQAKAALKVKKMEQADRALGKANLKQFLARKGK